MDENMDENIEVTCDICGSVYDDIEEINEFFFFDYTMGEKSQYPNQNVKFCVCQDCFIDAFKEIFKQYD
jgi:hypothetical protein